MERIQYQDFELRNNRAPTGSYLGVGFRCAASADN